MVFHARTPIFEPRGEGSQNPAWAPFRGNGKDPRPGDTRAPEHSRPQVGTHAPAPKPSPDATAGAPKSRCIFLHSFATVMTVTQTLQFAVEKQIQVAAVWNHMVCVSCSDTKSVLCTFTAERLAGQLSVSASLPSKARVRVQVMPGSRFFALRLWLVIRAIPLRGQALTPRGIAHTHGLVHVNLRRKTKSLHHESHHCETWHRLKAQALVEYSRHFPGGTACT